MSEALSPLTADKALLGHVLAAIMVVTKPAKRDREIERWMSAVAELRASLPSNVIQLHDPAPISALSAVDLLRREAADLLDTIATRAADARSRGEL